MVHGIRGRCFLLLPQTCRVLCVCTWKNCKDVSQFAPSPSVLVLLSSVVKRCM